MFEFLFSYLVFILEIVKTEYWHDTALVLLNKYFVWEKYIFEKISLQPTYPLCEQNIFTK